MCCVASDYGCMPTRTDRRCPVTDRLLVVAKRGSAVLAARVRHVTIFMVREIVGKQRYTRTYNDT